MQCITVWFGFLRLGKFCGIVQKGKSRAVKLNNYFQPIMIGLKRNNNYTYYINLLHLICIYLKTFDRFFAFPQQSRQ